MSYEVRDYQAGYSGLTADDIAKFLKREFTEDEAELATDLIEECEIELCRRCNRQFLAFTGGGSAPEVDVEYYQFFNANFTKIRPAVYPVKELVGIEIDGVDKTTLYTENTDFWLYRTLIKFANPVVSAVRPEKAVKLTVTIEKFWGKDVELLLKKWVGFEFMNSENAGLATKNMSFADVSQNYDLDKFQKEIDRIVFRYAEPLV